MLDHTNQRSRLTNCAKQYQGYEKPLYICHVVLGFDLGRSYGENAFRHVPMKGFPILGGFFYAVFLHLIALEFSFYSHLNGD